MTILIVLDSPLRFTTCHPEFARNSHLGYANIAYDQFCKLPEDLRLTLFPIKIPKMVCPWGRGFA